MATKWNDVEAFCAVAALGSFTRAAERLDMPKSSVSRAVANLETSLGVRLVERSTRRLRLTDAGRGMHEQMAPLFERMHDVIEESLARRDQPQGVLRILTPFEFGILQLNEVICDLLLRHANLEAEIEMSSRHRHPLEGNFDLVFSLHESDPEDSSLVGLRVFTIPTLLCAAPSLVARLGMPQHPEDLARWPCLADGPDAVWRFTQPGHAQVLEVRVNGPLRTGSASLRLGAAEAGIGAAVIASSLCREAVEQGRLLPLLPALRPMPRRVYAFMPTRRLIPARLRVFLDALESLVQEDDQPLRTSPLKREA